MSIDVPPQQHYIPAEERKNREFTIGDWSTEAESAAAFDAAVPLELFRMHREVRGTLLQPRPAQVDRTVRIDRVLVPTEHLLDLGWKFGIIGCELKRSGEKIGPPIAQAIDYGRSVFTLEPSKFRIYLDYVFIWPMAKHGGTLGSICAQQRIGSALGDGRYSRFALKSGETGILDVQCDGRIRIGGTQAGAKVGSR